jgi:GTPase Era involved in 16S rRNA processing
MNTTFFYNFYLNVINSIFNNKINNQELLLFIDNEFNILNDFSHYIKKNNIRFDIVISNYKFYNNMLENLKGEECELLINLNLKVDKIENKKFNLVIFFHVESIEKLENTLIFLQDKLCDNFKIYIYCSLTKKSKNKIFFKNIIREQIMNFTSNKMGYILCYENFVNTLNKNNFYNINSIKVFKENEYFIYGSNTVYEIILDKK